MPRIKKILCPTDLSDPSRMALQYAVNMARYEGAELLLLHVLPPLGLVHGIASVAPLGQVIEAEAQEKMAVLIAECVSPDVRSQVLVRVGDEAEEIHRAALEADVVVMSTHGRTGWAHWAFGSVAESVMREATCPIFAIGPSGAAGVKETPDSDGQDSCFDFPYKQILWPTDWSESSERALDEAVKIAAYHDAQLLMLHVIELPELGVGGWSCEQYVEAETRFEALCERQPGTCGARRLISRGVPAAEIKRVAVEEGADLIVMSTHGRTGWQRLKLGSVAQKVLRYVPCSVYLVPPHATLATECVAAQSQSAL